MPNLEFLDKEPTIAPSAFIADGVHIIGDVTIGEESSVWYGSVLRGDINCIRIGQRSNLQDGTVVHLSDDFGVEIGDDVTIGHRALIHACTIGDGVLVGMGAIIMDGVVIGAGSIVGAGALVLAGTEVPARSLVLGSPAKVVRELDETERKEGARLAAKYVLVAQATSVRRSPSEPGSASGG
ncbi:MAG: carbonic anhydrase/acetyltransferase-like protein (isoleucine patch superfamily) [Pseudoalteromonas tetraodonis]|jgi:carbonic anhydrase/acetyltransferase-like protein (isoleucine patch superfamily)